MPQRLRLRPRPCPGSAPVNEALRGDHAKAKNASRHADDGDGDGTTLHSVRTLLQALGTVAYNVTSTSFNTHAKIVLTTLKSLPPSD